MSTPPKPNSSVPLRADDFTLKDAVEHTWFKTTMNMYIVSEDKLNDLTSSYDSFNLLFFGIFVGAAVSLGIAWRETASETARLYYFASFLACLLGGIYTGVRGCIDFQNARKKREKLFKESTALDFVPAKNRPMPPSEP